MFKYACIKGKKANEVTLGICPTIYGKKEIV